MTYRRNSNSGAVSNAAMHASHLSALHDRDIAMDAILAARDTIDGTN